MNEFDGQSSGIREPGTNVTGTKVVGTEKTANDLTVSDRGEGSSSANTDVVLLVRTDLPILLLCGKIEDIYFIEKIANPFSENDLVGLDLIGSKNSLVSKFRNITYGDIFSNLESGFKKSKWILVENDITMPLAWDLKKPEKFGEYYIFDINKHKMTLPFTAHFWCKIPGAISCYFNVNWDLKIRVNNYEVVTDKKNCDWIFTIDKMEIPVKNLSEGFCEIKGNIVNGKAGNIAITDFKKSLNITPEKSIVLLSDTYSFNHKNAYLEACLYGEIKLNGTIFR